MKRLLGLLTTWSERIISAAPSQVQQRARRNADRLLRLVGGNPNVLGSAFLTATLGIEPRPSSVAGPSSCHPPGATVAALAASGGRLLDP